MGRTKALCDECSKIGDKALEVELCDWTSGYQPYVARFCVDCTVVVDGKVKIKHGGPPRARADHAVDEIRRKIRLDQLTRGELQAARAAGWDVESIKAGG